MYDIVTVKNGYAQNYLFPRGLAELATAPKVAALSERRAEIEAARAAAHETLSAAIKGLNGPLVMRAHANEEGHLYDKVTNHKIADALSELTGQAVDAKKVHLAEPITAIGEYTVKVALGVDVHEVPVHVEALAE
jgi:large subunit ribosomal protein L9